MNRGGSRRSLPWLLVVSVGVVVAPFIAAPIVWRHGWIAPDVDPAVWVDQAIEQGDSIVEAIEQYEATHGKPPTSLADLVPDLLPEIPVLHGSGWEYQAFEDHERKSYYFTAGSWDVLVLDVNEEGRIREEWITQGPDPESCPRIPFDADMWKRGVSRLEMFWSLHDQMPFVGRNISEVESMLGPPSEVRLLRRTPWELSNHINYGLFASRYTVWYLPGENYEDYYCCWDASRVSRWAVMSSHS